MAETERYLRTPYDAFMNQFLPTSQNAPVFQKQNHNMSIDLTSLDVADVSDPWGDYRTSVQYKHCYSAVAQFICRALSPEGKFVTKCVKDWPVKSLLKSDTYGYGLAQWTRRGFAIFKPEKQNGDALNVKVGDDSNPSDKSGPSRSSPPQAPAVVVGKVMLDHPVVKDGTDFIINSAPENCVLAQLAECAGDIQLRQHRQFVFMFYIYRTSARLMRWDRQGVVMSDNIDLKTEPEKLYAFFYRLRYASDIELGFDPTATLLYKDLDHDDNLQSLRRAISTLEPRSRTTSYIQAAFGGTQWPFYVLEVPDKDDPTKTHSFLVRNAATTRTSPMGRGTKGYIAFDLQTNKFCYLKDAWRRGFGRNSKNAHTELDVYRVLELYGISCVATVCCGGDLTYGPNRTVQTTRAQANVPAAIARHRFPMVHTRIVFNEVGIPLKDFLSTWELCGVVLSAFVAHAKAWTQAEILHCDISEGNILIYENQSLGRIQGLLIDWDSAKFKRELTKEPVGNGSAGTWRYMSASLCHLPRKDNDVSDDIESFLHLLCEYDLRFHRRDLVTMEVERHIRFLSYRTNIGGLSRGGYRKLRMVQSGSTPFRWGAPDDAFTSLLNQLFSICQCHYSVLDMNELEKRYGVQTAYLPTPAPTASSHTMHHPPPDIPDWFPVLNDAFRTPPPSPPPPPRAELTLANHRAFGSAIYAALCGDKRWYTGDKTGDKLCRLEWYVKLEEPSASSTGSVAVSTPVVKALYPNLKRPRPDEDEEDQLDDEVQPRVTKYAKAAV